MSLQSASRCGAVLVAVMAVFAGLVAGSAGPGGSVAVADVDPTPLGEFTSLTPARILDTRSSLGGHPGPVGPGESFSVQITGRGGVPASGVDSVVVNATVTNTTGASFLTIWPSGVARPLISNLNYVPGLTVPNLVTVAVGNDGKLSIYNDLGSVDVIFDVVGYYAWEDGTAGSRFHGVAPFRYFDTRFGSGGVGTVPVAPGGTLKFKVTGKGGVPETGVTAVVMNVTVTQPSGASFLTVYPDDVSRPLASNLNFVPGQTVPNLVTVRVPANGTIDFYNDLGETHLLADLVGYYDGDKSTEAGRLLTSTPGRIFDTRASSPFPAPGSLPPRGILSLVGVNSDFEALLLNVTATEPTAASYITVFPHVVPTVPPLASNLNVVPGQTVPNLVIARVGTDARIDFYNDAGNTHLIADVFGGFTSSSFSFTSLSAQRNGSGATFSTKGLRTERVG